MPRFPRRPAPPSGGASQAGLFGVGTLTGTIERVRFRAEDTGYTVLVIVPDELAESVVAVGHLGALREGERVRFEGEWKDHPRYGRQFQVRVAQPLAPATAEGIEKFLAAGPVKHIGPALARRIVERFGERTLEVFDQEPQRLLEIPGLGQKKLAEALDSWRSHGEAREVMLFLQQNGLSLHLAEKIFRAYGAQAIPILRENPYRLATDIFGVGFRTADRVARQIGFPQDDPARCAAGALYLLQQLSERDGHVFVPWRGAAEEAAGLLGVEPARVEEALESLRRQGAVVVEEAAGERRLYAKALHASECEVARRLAGLLKTPRDEARLESALRGLGVSGGNLRERLRRLAQRALEGGQATGDQARAIEDALAEKALVVTGGPGTGKTTIVNAVTRLYGQLGLQVLLAAPTGRAAKRLAEVTGHEASTIHRLLEYSWTLGGFARNASQPLAADAVIIDEASMLDIHLAASLLRAVPDMATFVLVGDVDQLPSVGPGNVLRDVIESGGVPVVRLKEVFRQAKESLIVENAHRVNGGEMPLEAPPEREGADFFFIEEADPARCADLIVELCRERIPRRFGLDPIQDIQVLAPMQRGVLGVRSLNERLQEALNPAGGGPLLLSGGRAFRKGDKLIQIRNNYDKNVFNGDIGVVERVDPAEGALWAAFDGEIVEYTAGSLDEVVHAFAVTVHKSQGSEYPAVVVPLHTQHFPMLQRNLVYTALTRARRLAVFVGTKKALAIALKNARVRRRWSRLAERLRSAAGLPPAAAGEPPAEPMPDVDGDEAI
ncbi:MAG: ATP-dependent RecD-like DNA helicase [Candidatus Tectomicrobia bacterium]|uniref:ATP-dependent RecD-like DNA helicase n=1 Tax=Tectimicrobiota bacterium TaxID=2528274 RepID=A0A932MN47_UNCTE|nr:ATP-dependent RecD-like DNA helicase [Candidatus Tectomicrobia bacterium]